MSTSASGNAGAVIPRRMMSPLLAQFPWYTSTVTSYDDLSEVENISDQFHGFSRHLHNFESILFSISGINSRLMSMQKYLGLTFSSSLSPTMSAELVPMKPVHASSPQEMAKVFTIVGAYRLLDVVSLVSGAESGRIVQRTPYDDAKSLSNFRGWDRLENWPQILFDFKKSLDKSRQLPAAFTSVQQGSGPLRLLQMMERNHSTRAYSAVESNFLFAAMHLACMQDFKFPREICPDLLDANDSLHRKHPLPPEDLETLRILYAKYSPSGGDGPSRLRSPLHLALFISPLFLLLPFNIIKKSYNRQAMIDISRCLGNQKPQVILEVEKAIWNTLFSLVSGTIDPLGLLQNLSDKMPWSKIDSAQSTDSVRRWFCFESSAIARRISGEALNTIMDLGSALPDRALILRANKAVEPNTLPAVIHKTIEDGTIDPKLVMSKSMASKAGQARLLTSGVSNSDTPHITEILSSQDIFTEDSGMNVDHDTQENFSGDEGIGNDKSIIMSLNTGEKKSQPNDEKPTGDETSDEDADHENDEDYEDNSERQKAASPEIVQEEDRPATEDKPEAEEASDPHSDGSSDWGQIHQRKSAVSRDEQASDDPDQNSDDVGNSDGGKIHKGKSVVSGDEQASDGIDEGEDEMSDNDREAMDTNPDTYGKKSTTQNTASSPSITRKSDRGAKKSFVSYSYPETKIFGKKRRRNEADEDNSGTKDNPIDVELYTSIWEPAPIQQPKSIVKSYTLRKTMGPARKQCDVELRAFDAEGKEHTFTPESHYADTIKRLKDLFHHVEEYYEKGKPVHLAAPDQSYFEVIKYSDFKNLSAPAIQDRLRRRNIVVTGCPHPDLQFDAAGFRTLCPLKKLVSIQDNGSRERNTMISVVRGMAGDILDHGTKPNGKILNGLEFPMWKDTQWDNSSFTTDLLAWEFVRGSEAGGHPTPSYPIEHVRWGLAGTANSFTDLHIDSDGFGTFVQVMCGKKVWGICRPTFYSLSSTEKFLDAGSRLDQPLSISTGLNPEAIVLRQGDLLLMQPGQPHFVVGLENTICHGGHFYSTGLMKKTLESLLHTFVLSTYITNVWHHESRQLLMRICLFYGLGFLEKKIDMDDLEHSHLPDVNTFDGLLDLISACTLAILGNVLDFRTYSAPNQDETDQLKSLQKVLMTEHDRNNIPGYERLMLCYVRGMALEILDWIRSSCVISVQSKSPGETTDVSDFPSLFVVRLLLKLLDYKKEALKAGHKGAPHCTMALLTTQVENVVTCDQAIHALWKIRDTADSTDWSPYQRYDMTPPDTSDWTVKWKEGNFQGSGNYQRRGTTPLDKLFFQGEQLRRNMETEAARTLAKQANAKDAAATPAKKPRLASPVKKSSTHADFDVPRHTSVDMSDRDDALGKQAPVEESIIRVKPAKRQAAGTHPPVKKSSTVKVLSKQAASKNA